MIQLSTEFRSELSMVTFILLWSISFLPLVLGNDDLQLEGLQVKIIQDSKDLTTVKNQTGTCADEAHVAGSCPVWAGHGECSENPTFMLKNCRKSCNVCGGICVTEITAQPGDHLSVHYTGRFDNENGKIFDTSHDSGQLYNFQLGAGQVIQGYEVGVPGMCKGETRTLTVPPHLAYGDRGYPDVIPGGATLHFTVELVKIKKGKLQNLPSPPRGDL